MTDIISSITCQPIPATDNAKNTFDSRMAILIPAYNEGRHLAELLERCRQARPEIILIVDDCSTDSTDEVLRNESRVQHAPDGAPGAVRLVVLRNDYNLGKQGSVRRGLRYLAAEDLDGIAVIDGDLQHNPAELPQLAELLKLFDVVIGARSHDEMPRLRRFSNWVVNRGFSALSGVDFVDIQSGLRLYAKPIADALATWLPAKGRFGLEHESLALLAQLSRDSGSRIDVAAAPIACAYGDEQSHIGVSDIARLAWQTVRQGMRVRALRRPQTGPRALATVFS